MVEQTGDLVTIPADGVTLEGNLDVPADAPGVVVFAHGSGSSRKSPRNNFVADVIRDRGVGTLLFDLLTEAEDRNRRNRFDIPRLTDRLLSVTEWVREQPWGSGLAVGYFGSSTGAGAALRAAARRGDDVDAVVSRGGRVDLASEALSAVTAPTLFVVGGSDTQVLRLNRDAYDRLTCERSLHVVEGAGHLFEAEHELREVATAAADWFEQHLS
mgnify:FL=1